MSLPKSDQPKHELVKLQDDKLNLLKEIAALKSAYERLENVNDKQGKDLLTQQDEISVLNAQNRALETTVASLRKELVHLEAVNLAQPQLSSMRDSENLIKPRSLSSDRKTQIEPSADSSKITMKSSMEEVSAHNSMQHNTPSRRTTLGHGSGMSHIDSILPPRTPLNHPPKNSHPAPRITSGKRRRPLDLSAYDGVLTSENKRLKLDVPLSDESMSASEDEVKSEMSRLPSVPVDVEDHHATVTGATSATLQNRSSIGKDLAAKKSSAHTASKLSTKHLTSNSSDGSVVKGSGGLSGSTAQPRSKKVASPNHVPSDMDTKPEKFKKPLPMTIPTSLLRSFRGDVPKFNIHPPAITSCLVRRSFLREQYGGSDMQFIQVIQASRNPSSRDSQSPRDRHLVFPRLDLNPGVPNQPGEPGAIFSARLELLNHQSWTVFIKPGKEAIWLYIGEYGFEICGTITAEVFANQKPEVQRSWAQRIIDVKQWDAYVSIRARIGLRKKQVKLQDDAVLVEMGNIKANKGIPVTVDDVVNSFTCGDEGLEILRMTCVAYDHQFIGDILQKSRDVGNTDVPQETQSSKGTSRRQKTAKATNFDTPPGSPQPGPSGSSLRRTHRQRKPSAAILESMKD